MIVNVILQNNICLLCQTGIKTSRERNSRDSLYVLVISFTPPVLFPCDSARRSRY